MPFTGIFGLPGKGKSLFQIQYGLRIAEQYQLRVVSNFFLNQYALAYYCKVHGYTWLFENIGKGVFYYVSTNKNFAQLLQVPNSVILIDEFGLYAPASQHWTLPPEAHNAIANNRKNLQFIVFATQYPSQINSCINEILTDVVYCEGTTVWSKDLKNEKLLFKDSHAFNPAEFDIWYKNPKMRKNPIKTMFLAKKHWRGQLNCIDALSFKVYDSFSLLERQDSKINYQETEFGYNPYIISQQDEEKLGDDRLKQSGFTLSELDKLSEAYAEAESKKRKKIYQASSIPPFLCWKLEGSCPVRASHPLNKYLVHLWYWLPAASYPGLKKLDFLLDKEFHNFNKLSSEEKKQFFQMVKFFKNLIITMVILFIIGIVF